MPWRLELRRIFQRRLRDDDLPVDGLENQLINEVMLSSEWTVKRDWKFAKEGHISTFWRSELSTASSVICWGWDLPIVLWPWWTPMSREEPYPKGGLLPKPYRPF